MNAIQSSVKSSREILKDFKPDRNHFGQLIFVDEKLRAHVLQVYTNGKLSKIFNSTRKGFLIEVDKRGRFKALNPYKDPHNKILPRTLGKLFKGENEIELEIKKRKRDEKNARAIKPNKIVPTALANLPRKVLVLDIETTGKLDVTPDSKRISVVGIKEYNLVAGGYQPLSFEHYDGFDDWAALKSRLKQPCDIILGHNLFGFDYYFLEDVLDLPRLMPKTVDLFLWLYTCAGSRSWLGLDKLCRLNLGIWKLRSGKTGKELSALNDKTLLYRYNERDLDLTFRLWLHVIEQKSIKTWASGCLKVNSSDLDFLLGRKLLVDYRLWRAKRRVWNSNQPSPLNPAIIIRKLGEHDPETATWKTYSALQCDCCMTTTVYLVTEQFRRSLGNEGVISPDYELLKRTLKSRVFKCAGCTMKRTGLSCEVPIQIGSFSTSVKQGKNSSATFVVDRGMPADWIWDKELLKQLDKILETFWNQERSWFNTAGIDADFYCQTCGHALTIHDLPLVHPVFKTSLCQACIRLGRHRYFHKGKFLPDLKRRRRFSDDLVPMRDARNRTAFFAR